MKVWWQSGVRPGISRLEMVVVLLTVVVVLALGAAVLPARRAEAVGNSGPQTGEKVMTLMIPGFSATTGDRTYRLADGEQPWVPGNHVMARRDAVSYVEGMSSIALDVAEPFTTGVLASLDITPESGALDLSDCESISFWIKSDTGGGSGALQIILREGGPAEGAPEKLSIPGNALDGTGWHQVTLPLSGRTERYDAVSAIALVAAEDPGPRAVWLDIIEARRAGHQVRPQPAHAGEAELTAVETVLMPTRSTG
ncbi:MAG: hypothetical protein ABID87_03820 [Chloroflexota bacterium]